MTRSPAPWAARVTDMRPLGGGDINDAFRVQFEDESFGFVKTRADVGPASTRRRPPRCAGSPSRGAPARAGGARGGQRVLVLDWVDEGRARRAVGVRSGARRGPRGARRDFGATPPAGEAQAGEAGGVRAPLRLASRTPMTPRPTGRASTPSGGCCRCCLTGATRFGNRAVERVCARIHELAGPPEPPARLHGDLWSGNVLGARDGQAWLIDPAAYGGHREVDLAMLRLFGAPGALPSRLRGAPPAGARSRGRVELYQLFPLLVHAALFGGGYPASAERVARKYA